MKESVYELDYEIILKEDKFIDFIDQNSEYYELWESSSIGDKFLYFSNSGFLYKLDSTQNLEAELNDVLETLISESENRGTVFRPQEVEKKLYKVGFVLVGQKGSHRHYESPLKKGKVTIAFHPGDLPGKDFRSILRQAQISEKEFRKIITIMTATHLNLVNSTPDTRYFKTKEQFDEAVGKDFILYANKILEKNQTNEEED